MPSFAALWFPLVCLCANAEVEVKVSVISVRVLGAEENGPRVSITEEAKHRVAIHVDPNGASQPIEIEAKLAETGPNAWPADDVYVETLNGKAVPIRRGGTDWHRFVMTVPVVEATYILKTWRDPKAASERALPEAARIAHDQQSGITVSIARWQADKKAALSIRFDDSHPSHLSTVVPLLDEYGYKATFMINPGRDQYRHAREAWEALARGGKHELGNHTLHHRGATNEAEIELELGEVSAYLWELLPDKSRLLAFNRGGGTMWTTTKPFSQSMKKFSLFHVDGSLGMDDVYGSRADALRTHLRKHIDRGGWCRAHFHSVGEGLATSESNFSEALEVVREFEDDIWITGLADAYKYQTARKFTKLALRRDSEKRLLLSCEVQTDPGLYDEPLTLRVEFQSEHFIDQLFSVRTGSEIPCLEPSNMGVNGKIALFSIPATSAVYELR